MRTVAAFVFGAMLLVASSPSAADTILSTNLIGQPTAHVSFGPPNAPSSYDVFVDIKDGSGNSLCQAIPGDPCFVASQSGQSSLTSGQFSSGADEIWFDPLANGSFLPVIGAGLNQSQSPTDSFFDVFFDVDLGGGMHRVDELAFDVQATSPLLAHNITGPAAIGWPPPPNVPSGEAVNGFFLGLQANGPFQITLRSVPFLPNLAPPALTPNPNVVPEPSTLLLLGLGATALLAWRRRLGKSA